METFYNELKTKIISKRNIKDNSLKAYFRNLDKLIRLLDLNDVNNLDFLNNPDKIIKALDGKKHSTIRNYLASIVVFLSIYDNKKELTDKYRKLMEKYAKEYNEMVDENKMNKSQKENWTSLSALKKVLNDYKKQLNIKKSLQKNSLSRREFDLLQMYVAGSLYIADDENPPLRLDYAPMYIINKNEYDKLTDNEKKEKNYLVNQNRKTKYFSIGSYKTEGKYGTKIFPIGKKLNTVLNTWLKFNKTDKLLINSNDEIMSSNGLTKYLNKVFSPLKKNISASLLRHIYITENIKPITDKQKELAEKMLHSTNQQGDYIKS